MTGESVAADHNMEALPEILATVTSQLLWSSATMNCGGHWHTVLLWQHGIAMATWYGQVNMALSSQHDIATKT